MKISRHVKPYLIKIIQINCGSKIVERIELSDVYIIKSNARQMIIQKNSVERKTNAMIFRKQK